MEKLKLIHIWRNLFICAQITGRIGGYTGSVFVTEVAGGVQTEFSS